MIDYAKTIEDRTERTQMANLIVDAMALVNPKVKERTDYRRILWDHLMMMAEFDLDVDCPYPINREETEVLKPQPLHYSDSEIRYRHYGRALEDMIRADRDSVDDDLIREQLTELSSGRITLPADFEFHDTKLYIDAMAAVAAKKESNAKKKKKKKK